LGNLGSEKKNASSSLWLMAHNRCWTADRLARRGLPHPEECPLCEQEDEDHPPPPLGLCICTTILASASRPFQDLYIDTTGG